MVLLHAAFRVCQGGVPMVLLRAAFRIRDFHGGRGEEKGRG
jgi:hypothetical protein